jgi:hypothetical protein
MACSVMMAPQKCPVTSKVYGLEFSVHNPKRVTFRSIPFVHDVSHVMQCLRDLALPYSAWMREKSRYVQERGRQIEIDNPVSPRPLSPIRVDKGGR